MKNGQLFSSETLNFDPIVISLMVLINNLIGDEKDALNKFRLLFWLKKQKQKNVQKGQIESEKRTKH